MIYKGNYVKLACFVLLAVSEEAKARLPFFRLMYNKKLLDLGFVRSRIIKVEVMVNS